MKKCTKCLLVKELSEYHKKGRGIELRTICKKCTNKDRQLRRDNRTEEQIGYDAKLNRLWIAANREHKRTTQAKWFQKNKAKCNKNSRSYYAKYPEKCAARKAVRRAPANISKEENILINNLYKIAKSFGYHVHHILPVSMGGLTVFDNLMICSVEEHKAVHRLTSG